MTAAAPRLSEAADSLVKASTHQRVGHTGKGLWGHPELQLPAYIQHVANDLIKDGKAESQAVHLAVGIIENWKDGHDGKGHPVEETTKVAAAKAWAEWQALRAKAKSLTAAKRLTEAGRITHAAPLVEAQTSGETAVSRARRQATTSSGARAVDQARFSSQHPRVGKGTTGGGRFVRSGGKGAEVKGVQRRVGAKADGDFGKLTAAAVRRFQRTHGLVVDGVVGRQTAAALRGNRDAKNVKVGGLLQSDVEFLRGKAGGTTKRGGGAPMATSTDGAPRNITAKLKGGGTRKVNPTEFKELRRRGRLVEAVAVPSVLARAQALEKGEHVMLPDGHAVRRAGTIDGRDVWQIGRPRSYSTDGMRWDDEQHTSVEKAVARAMTSSASHDHPDSVGGESLWHTYARVTVAGRDAEYVGADAHGQPLVRVGDAREPTGTAWSSMLVRPRP